MMFKNDKNIVSAMYRDEAWVDPKTVAATERQLRIKKIYVGTSCKGNGKER